VVTGTVVSDMRVSCAKRYALLSQG
jgi:hypothetical protein